MSDRHPSPADSTAPTDGVAAWLRLAGHPATVRRALATAAIVGALLIAINHGDEIVQGEMTPARWMKVVLTFIVPYLVSTASSVATRRELLDARRP